MARVFRKNESSILSCLLLVTAMMLLLSETESITLRPNTRMEFASLRCRGEFDKNGYSALTRVCEDCYNLFRDKTVFNNCK
ncbi:Arthropod neurohormone/Alpha-latrotoxin associated low molecular weight protein [Trinorchestia longiramus]|nr:Arthropod neurohormone/Alpha-latrotoxin associated low molecular weight protein [Trinorchestia longiramus]